MSHTLLICWQAPDSGRAHLGLALDKGVKEGGEGEVAQGVAVIYDRGSGQQGARHGRHARVHVRCQRHKLPPGHPLRPRMQRLPATPRHKQVAECPIDSRSALIRKKVAYHGYKKVDDIVGLMRRGSANVKQRACPRTRLNSVMLCAHNAVLTNTDSAWHRLQDILSHRFRMS